MNNWKIAALAGAVLVAGFSTPADAIGERLREMLRSKGDAAQSSDTQSGDASSTFKGETAIEYDDRTLYVHVPTRLPQHGTRALVVVLHGGLGNAERIVKQQNEAGMNLDEVADKYGFLVAYMNGTPVTKRLGADKRGWNAGLCCGESAKSGIDDVAYITGAVQMLAHKYGIDARRVYGIGHSNGAMMTQRIICETGLYAAGVSFSGTLNVETTSCPGAQGRAILAVHGQGDKAVPLEGGYGEGISDKNFKKSQAYAKELIEAGGGTYTLQIYPEAEHKFDTIDEAVLKQDGMTVPEKVARFFKLDKENR